MSKNKMTRCPKCGEKSFTEIRQNIYQCVSCDHRKNLNDFEWYWLMPSIAIGSFAGLIVVIFGWSLLNKNVPNSPNNSVVAPTTKFQQAPILPTIASESIFTSIVPIPTPQPQPQSQPKPIAKAISGNQVTIELKGKATTVLLCGLNSATPKSKYFTAATNHLQQLLDRTGADNLDLVAISKARDVAIVELYDRRENISLNAQQVASGYAVSSQVLAKPCRDRNQIVNAAQQAQIARNGIWAN